MCSNTGPLGERLGLSRGKKSSGEQSSGGIGGAMAITRPPGTQRMQRTASTANFMALFGPQQGS